MKIHERNVLWYRADHCIKRNVTPKIISPHNALRCRLLRLIFVTDSFDRVHNEMKSILMGVLVFMHIHFYFIHIGCIKNWRLVALKPYFYKESIWMCWQKYRPAEIPSTQFFVERLVFNDYQSFLSLGMENTSPNVTCEAKNQKRGGNIVRGHHKKIRW